MNARASLWVVVAAAVTSVLTAGCGGGQTVEIRYERSAVYEVPDRIRKVGIARFGGQTSQDKKWGDIAADRLAAALDAYNHKYNRYQLVDRKRLGAILDQRDLEMAISDSTAAGEAGKLAKVDAMIYGTVHVVARDEKLTKQKVDFLGGGTKTVYYTKRYVMASVNFTMNDISTGKTITTVTPVQEFDSEKGGFSKEAGSDDGSTVKKVTGALGLGGSDDLPPTDQIVNRLIDQCVQDFLSKVSPHEVIVIERLRSGDSEAVKTGNKLAGAGEYVDALEFYTTVMERDLTDDGAIFNAGVISERLGRLADALKYYDKAFKLDPTEQYAAARARVRKEMGR